MRLKEFTNDNVANWQNIATRNAIANPNLIQPGKVLDVGDGIVLPKGTTYTVKPGDTLSGIAKNIRQGRLPDSSSPSPSPAPKVSKPEISRGGPTVSADSGKIPATKSARPDYHDPLYNISPDSAPVDDEALKKRLGINDPIPNYQYDMFKDKEIADKLAKQDQQRQQRFQKQPGGSQGIKKPNKAPKSNLGLKSSSKSEFDKVLGIESGNQDYTASGQPVTSQKGAKYAAQVMPTTNINPGYGVKPAANAGPEESNRVGRDYFNAMKNKYGNSELAAAAYNAGPRRIDKILQKAKETGRHWKDFLPAETQNYIKKFTGK